MISAPSYRKGRDYGRHLDASYRLGLWGWPASGEIDIMEHVGYNQGMVYGTVHTKAFNHGIGIQKGDSIVVADAHNDFHVYAIDWSPEKIDFMVDGEIYNTFSNEGTGSEAWPLVATGEAPGVWMKASGPSAWKSTMCGYMNSV